MIGCCSAEDGEIERIGLVAGQRSVEFGSRLLLNEQVVVVVVVVWCRRCGRK
jgi:hypothetical protein